MTRYPEFDELVGEGVAPSESERLRRVHELLVAVGPPPELSPELASAPSPTGAESRVVGLPARGAGRLLAIAAVVAVLALVLGYIGGRRSGGFKSEATIQMHGTAAAHGASALIRVGEVDASGNWPLKVETSGLRQLRKGAWYELYLTRHGKPSASCGTFRVDTGTTVVRLNAPYDFRRFDGWVVTVHRPGEKKHPKVLTQTSPRSFA
jgi:hypothetical protein